MIRAGQVYYNTIFGAIGAILAWLVIGQVDTTSWIVNLANLFVGAGNGLFLGASLGIVEGLLVKRTCLSVVIGVLGGAIAGLVSFLGIKSVFAQREIPKGLEITIAQFDASIYAVTPNVIEFTSLASRTGGKFYDIKNN